MNSLSRQVFNEYHPKKQGNNYKYCTVEQYEKIVYKAVSPSLCYNYIKVNQLKNAFVKFIR